MKCLRKWCHAHRCHTDTPSHFALFGLVPCKPED